MLCDLRLRAAAVLTAVVLGASACGGSEPAPAGPDPDDPGIGHIHGLGIDPADNALYLASHYGLFKINSVETAERVAGRIDDYMGFTIVGPKTFLASGHPGDPNATSPHLGLIRTTDAGQTWTTVSEGGTADFHALESVGDHVYGYDTQSQRLKVSTDQGHSWTDGAREPVIDLAANDADPGRLYATTPNGLRVSTNDGQAFATVEGAPLLSHVDSPAKDLLIGPDAEGVIRSSTDGGSTWQTGGRLPGQAAAFTAVDAQHLLAAMEDGTVYESKNGGKDFSVVFRPAVR